VIYMAGGNAYRLVRDHKNGWNPEAFRERYSDVLERYDYIVGDWGYNQLRLKGFFRDNHPKATKDTAISGLMDYLSEYCNFGCAWFVLAKVDRKQLPADETVVSVEPQVSAYIGETREDGQGLPMRWRADGTSFVPHISAYDLARAQAEMEKRRAAGAAASTRENGRNPGGSGNGAAGFRILEERWPGGGASRPSNAQNAPQAESAKTDEKPVRTHGQPNQGKGGRDEARAKRQQAGQRQEQPQGTRRHGEGAVRDAAPRSADASPREAAVRGGPEAIAGWADDPAESVQPGRLETPSAQGRSGGGRGGRWGRRNRHKRRKGQSFRPPSDTPRTDN